jgi:adenosylcobinamide kinase/adenosylcobinamide-phosphate guanylyltransferase
VNILVLGKNGCGKSAFAEKAAWALSKPGRLHYIACMVPYGEDGIRRVERHVKDRAPYGFLTLEKPACVNELPLGADDVFLLEDASNLLANAMFELGLDWRSVFSDVSALAGRCSSSVIVSIDGLEEDGCQDEETKRYICGLNQLNLELAKFCCFTIRIRRDPPYG